MSATTNIDAELIRTLAGLLDETKLTEIEYAVGEVRVRVARQPAAVQASVAAAPAPAASPIPAATPATGAEPAGAVKSPMVGTAYLAPQPGLPAFVKIGDTVSTGQTLLIIEAMKVMNQIRAPHAGKVTQILAQDTGPVEFGQVLMVVE